MLIPRASNMEPRTRRAPTPAPRPISRRFPPACGPAFRVANSPRSGVPRDPDLGNRESRTPAPPAIRCRPAARSLVSQCGVPEIHSMRAGGAAARFGRGFAAYLISRKIVGGLRLGSSQALIQNCGAMVRAIPGLRSETTGHPGLWLGDDCWMLEFGRGFAAHLISRKTGGRDFVGLKPHAPSVW